MTNNGNWFAVSRMIFDHYAVGAGHPVEPANPKKGSYSKMEAWLWLIANAAYEPNRIMNKGREMVLNPGQLMGAYAYLAETWNWTPATVRYFLSSLERLAMLHRQNSKQKDTRERNQCQVLTVCNYERYQITFQENPQALVDAFQQAKKQAHDKQAASAQQESNNKHLEREGEAAAAADASDLVKVNCSAIHGPGFKLDFGAIDMAAALSGVDIQRARQIAEICARDWAANGTKPTSPMAIVKRAIASDRNHKQTDEARLERVTKDTPASRRERLRAFAMEAEEQAKAKQKQWS